MLSKKLFITVLSLCFLLLFLSLQLDSADDMGLGKTLTMIALILAKKVKAKEEDEKKEEKKLEKWISKTGNKWESSVLSIQFGTIVII